MAVGDIFGTNLFNLALLMVADAFYRGGPILNQTDRFEIVAALLALIMTSIVLIGIVYRSERTLLGIGLDSVAVLFTYLAGLVLLFTIRWR